MTVGQYSLGFAGKLPQQASPCNTRTTKHNTPLSVHTFRPSHAAVCRLPSRQVLCCPSTPLAQKHPHSLAAHSALAPSNAPPAPPPGPPPPPHTHSLQAAEADTLLSKYTPKSGASTSPIDAARPTLLRAQLALEAGNVGAALGLMQQGLPAELTMKPAVVATRVALLEQVSVRDGGGMCVGLGEVGCVACRWVC